MLASDCCNDGIEIDKQTARDTVIVDNILKDTRYSAERLNNIIINIEITDHSVQLNII